MLNQVVMVGRLVADPEAKELEDGKTVSNIKVAVPRQYKNSEGEYETDFIDVTVWNNIANATKDYCKKGDMIGVKGRLQVDNYENDEGKLINKLKVIGEKITFLSSRNINEPEEVR